MAPTTLPPMTFEECGALATAAKYLAHVRQSRESRREAVARLIAAGTPVPLSLREDDPWLSSIASDALAQLRLARLDPGTSAEAAFELARVLAEHRYECPDARERSERATNAAATRKDCATRAPDRCQHDLRRRP